MPYALGDRDAYAAAAKKPFEAWGFELSSIHESDDPVASVKAADAIFIGGGNTFRLLKELYDHKVKKTIGVKMSKFRSLFGKVISSTKGTLI